MRYILEGEPKEVAKVIQENRIRAERGVIKFTPAQPETELDGDAIRTLIESHDAITKDCQRMAVAQHELADITREILASAMAHGGVLSDELATRLDKFGITVPKIEETVENPTLVVPESEENPENVADSVPEPGTNDDDMVEVNLDDVKDAPASDVKSEPEADIKDAPEPTPKKKTRTKKSE